ncbi:alpha/beta hydrolase [Roseibium sp. MMSF_3544]|uniref:alpha/beta hydrolase n=1 Tax=unclassified Roseibium TaxID=2629323 RepID=UPI00273D9E77|nr:alpha/beta hydrolase [Roseibium sp. MMSF_3544]
MKIYFASNRDVKHETSSSGNIFGNRFNEGGPQVFRVGEANVDYKGRKPKDDDSWSVGKTRLYDEDLDSSREEGELLGSSRLFEEMRKLLKKQDTDVILYIHGFANSFQNSVLRAAALQELYSSKDQQVVVFLFSWPSNGSVQPAWNYFSDREDAEASGIAMGRTLMRLVEFLKEMRQKDKETILNARAAGEVPDPKKLVQCTRRMHVLAHSMGNWALRHALRKYAELNNGRVDRILDSVFLMAADEDNDALEESLKLKRLDELANRIFVYHAANDVALTISDTTKGMPDRLGSDGPQNLDKISERMFAIDCTRISDTNKVSHGRHQYYRLRDEAIQDVQLTLSDTPQEGRPGREVIRHGRSWSLKPVK